MYSSTFEKGWMGRSCLYFLVWASFGSFSLRELTCMLCVYLVLWTRKVLCGSLFLCAIYKFAFIQNVAYSRQGFILLLACGSLRRGFILLPVILNDQNISLVEGWNQPVVCLVREHLAAKASYFSLRLFKPKTSPWAKVEISLWRV